MSILPELQSRFDHYNRKRGTLLQNLSALPPETLSKNLGPDRWSLLQVIEHLVKAERSVLMNLPDPSLLVHRPRGIRAQLGYLVVIWVLKWGLPVPVPEPAMIPDGHQSNLSVLRVEWDRNTNWLKHYLDNLTPSSAMRAVFRHPVTGPLTPDRALRLAHLHLGTHVRQIDRIRRAIGV